MMASALSRPARATVIIPTYGHAPYVLWALASARAQTVREMEICVLCDGSPPEIVEMLRSVAAEDDRIQVLQFSKAPRTGEIHRARVIPKTTGRIICYLCHDDLWFPRHVETLERLLQTADFGHTLHIFAGLGSDLGTVRDALPADIAHPAFRDKMLDTRVPHNFFGLTYGAHTREAYFRLKEGWSVTPDGIWTDLHMWRKFLSAPWCRCASYMGITALHFERSYWTELYSPEEFERELGRCFAGMADPAFLEDLLSQTLQQALNKTAELEALFSSVSWKITEPFRELFENHPALAYLIKRILRFTYDIDRYLKGFFRRNVP